MQTKVLMFFCSGNGTHVQGPKCGTGFRFSHTPNICKTEIVWHLHFIFFLVPRNVGWLWNMTSTTCSNGAQLCLQVMIFVSAVCVCLSSGIISQKYNTLSSLCPSSQALKASWCKYSPTEAFYCARRDSMGCEVGAVVSWTHWRMSWKLLFMTPIICTKQECEWRKPRPPFPIWRFFELASVFHISVLLLSRSSFVTLTTNTQKMK